MLVVRQGCSHQAANIKAPQSLFLGPVASIPPPTPREGTPKNPGHGGPGRLPLHLPHRRGTRGPSACHHLPPADQSDVWPSFHFKSQRRGQSFGVHIGGKGCHTAKRVIIPHQAPRRDRARETNNGPGRQCFDEAPAGVP